MKNVCVQCKQLRKFSWARWLTEKLNEKKIRAFLVLFFGSPTWARKHSLDMIPIRKFLLAFKSFNSYWKTNQQLVWTLDDLDDSDTFTNILIKFEMESFWSKLYTCIKTTLLNIPNHRWNSEPLRYSLVDQLCSINIENLIGRSGAGMCWTHCGDLIDLAEHSWSKTLHATGKTD